MRKILLFLLVMSIFAAGCVRRMPPVAAGAWEADSIARATPKYVPVEIILEKALAYDQHTIGDTTPYGKTVHVFQWDKIREGLRLLDSLQREGGVRWAILQNKKNINGTAPLVNNYTISPYQTVLDQFGTDRYQSVPLFADTMRSTPYRYARDGSLVMLDASSVAAWAQWEAWQPGEAGRPQPAEASIKKPDTLRVAPVFLGGEWLVPSKYVRVLPDTTVFRHAIFADRHNQNICTVEKVGDKWLVRSMNPSTTGVHRPPYMRETPLGVFVLQEKRLKMAYLVDGSISDIEGFAPYANRFCDGAYVHGVPMQDPTMQRMDFHEYSSTLGSHPRSHMCVRTATSHAKYIFDNFPAEATVVFIIE